MNNLFFSYHYFFPFKGLPEMKGFCSPPRQKGIQVLLSRYLHIYTVLLMAGMDFVTNNNNHNNNNKYYYYNK